MNLSICQQWFRTNVSPGLIAEQTGEIEFLDVNHCITTDDDFGFVAKEFVKPTAVEGSSLTENNTIQRQHSSQSYLEKQ